MSQSFDPEPLFFSLSVFQCLFLERCNVFFVRNVIPRCTFSTDTVEQLDPFLVVSAVNIGLSQSVLFKRHHGWCWMMTWKWGNWLDQRPGTLMGRCHLKVTHCYSNIGFLNCCSAKWKWQQNKSQREMWLHTHANFSSSFSFSLDAAFKFQCRRGPTQLNSSVFSPHRKVWFDD